MLRIIHWLVAALVFVQIKLAVLNALLYEPRPVLAEALVQTHISIGTVVFVVMVLRVFARLRSPKPKQPAGVWLGRAAGLVHASLYVLLFALPISGYLKLAAFGYPVTVFGGVPLPRLPMNIPLAQAADLLHDTAALVLAALLFLHISAALFHRRLDGVPVLGHMSIRIARTEDRLRATR